MSMVRVSLRPFPVSTVSWALMALPFFRTSGDRVTSRRTCRYLRSFAISEKNKLQFRFMGYNILNHPNDTFIGDDPNLTLNFDAAGKLTNNDFGYARNKAGRRTIQLGVKFYF